jgi:hypothetical protein
LFAIFNLSTLEANRSQLSSPLRCVLLIYGRNGKYQDPPEDLSRLNFSALNGTARTLAAITLTVLILAGTDLRGVAVLLAAVLLIAVTTLLFTGLVVLLRVIFLVLLRWLSCGHCVVPPVNKNADLQQGVFPRDA